MTAETLEANGVEQNNHEHHSTENALALKHPAMIYGNRPVEASHLDIVGTYSSIGSNRPIVSSGLNISSTLTISGHRPIAVSGLKVSETYTVMGNRPVASNEIDDAASLMGFLD